EPSGEVLDERDLVEGVDDDPPDPGLERATDLRLGLVVPVQGDAFGRELGAQRDGELASRAHVQAQTVLLDPARDGPAQEGLARVVDVRAPVRLERLGEGVPEGAGTVAE